MRLGLGHSRLRLSRAWPRGAGHMLLEYLTPGGERLAGQWLGTEEGHPDVEALGRVAGRTRAAAGGGGAVATLPRAGVLLQAGGADRRLPALRQVLRDPASALVSHRPERRAVVRFARAGGADYAKVVTPHTTRPPVDLADWASRLDLAGVSVPRLLAVDLQGGVTLWSGLRGSALFDLLGSRELVNAARLVGRAMRALHETPAPEGLEGHDGRDEVRVLDVWVARLATFARHPAAWVSPELAVTAAAAAEPLRRALADREDAPSATIHRDLHDKQVFVTSAGKVGLIDLDTLAKGEPALDLSNLLVHLELRALQGLVPVDRAAEAARAVVAGYAPERRVLERMSVYAAGARLRLACVYAFRPRWSACARALLARRDDPCLGLATG